MGFLLYLFLSVRILHCNADVYIPEHPCATHPGAAVCVQARDIARCR